MEREIVIKIPEELHKNKKGYLTIMDAHMICDAVAKGTPLPKGHGRLIDEKDLSLMTVHLIDGMFVCDAPTIIEADKGE